METKVVLKNEEGMITKVIIPDDCDFEVKDRVVIVTPKKVVRTWDDLIDRKWIQGFWIHTNSEILQYNGPICTNQKDLFISEKHAKSALAMAQISQLMPYYGGKITDEEWEDEDMEKYVIRRYNGNIDVDGLCSTYALLAFHTIEQRNDFLKYNEQLVKDYLMIE